MSLLQIKVFIDETTDPPKVTNPTSENTRIPANIDQIEWSASIVGPHPPDLRITNLAFFEDAEKNIPIRPGIFRRQFNNGGHNRIAVFAQDLKLPSPKKYWYTLHFTQAGCGDLEWDPTITIDPRGV